MRKLLLVESEPGSLQACAEQLLAYPDIEIGRVTLTDLDSASEASQQGLMLLEPGSSTPGDLVAPETGHLPSLDRVVVVGGPQLDPAWVHSWLRAGAYDVLQIPVDPHELVQSLERAWTHMERRAAIPGTAVTDSLSFHRLLTHSAVYRRLLDRARCCSGHDGPVLIWGEPGTGKDTLAECMHQAGSRGHRAFVRVTAPELLELLSPPMGRDSSARTHHQPRLLRERLAVAQGGTLMISQLEELSVPTQAKLLRSLLHRLSGNTNELLPRGMRVMMSMRRSLAADVRRGVYRADLYHHLGLEVLHVPPLRERRADIELLALHALHAWSSSRPVGAISTEAMHHLSSYDYPCNVSELETIMELALRTERSDTLSASSLPSHVRQGAAAEAPAHTSPGWRTLEEVQADYTRQVLEHTRGNRSQAARILGISRTGLLCKIRRYGINNPPRDVGGKQER